MSISLVSLSRTHWLASYSYLSIVSMQSTHAAPLSLFVLLGNREERLEGEHEPDDLRQIQEQKHHLVTCMHAYTHISMGEFRSASSTCSYCSNSVCIYIYRLFNYLERTRHAGASVPTRTYKPEALFFSSVSTLAYLLKKPCMYTHKATVCPAACRPMLITQAKQSLTMS